MKSRSSGSSRHGYFHCCRDVCLSVSLPPSFCLSLCFGADTFFIKRRDEVNFFPKSAFSYKGKQISFTFKTTSMKRKPSLHSHTWQECKLVLSLWGTVWRFLVKLKIELPYDPAIPLLGIQPEKTIIQKDRCTPIHWNTVYNSHGMEATLMSTNRRTDKEKMVYTYIQWNITRP